MEPVFAFRPRAPIPTRSISRTSSPPWSANACTVVDVREPHEFAAGHIPNAVNMPLSRFDPQELPNGKPVVLVCQAGGRSKNALNRARAIGREDVKHYAGGTAGWRSRGGEVTV